MQSSQLSFSGVQELLQKAKSWAQLMSSASAEASANRHGARASWYLACESSRSWTVTISKEQASLEVRLMNQSAK